VREISPARTGGAADMVLLNAAARGRAEKVHDFGKAGKWRPN